MQKDVLIKEMRECIENKTPVDFFNKFTDALDHLFSEIEKLKSEVAKTRVTSALAIKWDSRFALSIIENQIEDLRSSNLVFYKPQIDELKKAYKEDIVTQSYDTFCGYWQDVMGVHPFMNYED